MYIRKTLILLGAALSIAILPACGDSKTNSDSDKESSSTNDSMDKNDNSQEKSEDNAALDELFEFKFSFDGKEYQLPISYTDMKADGWIYQDVEIEEEELEPNSYFSEAIAKDDMWIMSNPVNSGTETIKASDADLCGISATLDYIGGKEFKIAKDITIGKSTTDDVVAAFGEPDRTSNVITKYTYEKDLQVTAEFEFDDNNVLKYISLRNF